MAEARATISLVERLAAPISQDDLLGLYEPLLLIYDSKDFGTDKAGRALTQSWFEVHYKVMGVLPYEAVEIAVQHCLKTRKFAQFPTPAELFEIASIEAAEIKMIALRLRRAVNAGVTAAVPEKTEEDKEKMRAMVAEMRGPDGHIRLTRPIEPITQIGNPQRVASNLRRLAERSE